MSRCAFGTARRKLRYLVLPERPTGSEELSEEALAALVTRDAMIGVAKYFATRGGKPRMNGVHDMGGMHDMGPIQYEKNEPVFHELWESRVFATRGRDGILGKMDHRRLPSPEELIPPAEYLRMSYYEKWIAGLVELLVKSGLVTAAELESGRPGAEFA